MFRGWFLMTLCLACVLALTGCGKVAEEATEKAIEAGLEADGQQAEVELDADGGRMRITTEDGEMTVSGDDDSFTMTSEEGGMSMVAGAAAKVPDDFPKDVPLPDGFKPNMVQTMAENALYTVTGPAEGTVQGVADGLRAAAKEQGWTEAQTFSQPGVMSQFSGTKEGRSLTVMVVDEGDGEAPVVTIVTAKD